jgi:hypothetical protein
MILGLIVILWRTPEYTARRILSSNMVLGFAAARALKIACRQNRCADKSLRRARAAPFYLASRRPPSFPVPLSSAALTASTHRAAIQRAEGVIGECPAAR